MCNKIIYKMEGISLKETILYVNYIIDGILLTIQTKMIYEQTNEDELQDIHYAINWKNDHFISRASSITEGAVINLQNALPSNISVACCQSCRHGNFCPYGDQDNEIFCLKDMIFNNKSEVCDFFSENRNSLNSRSRRLLEFCTDYKPISHNEYYTYNDWML